MSKPLVQVAIAILLHQGKVLVGWRQAEQHQGNKHEFPGGKVEAGETPEQACRREVLEEVGIDIQDWHAFDCIQFEYDDVIVNLHLFHATVSKHLLADIHSPWAWFKRAELQDLNFPKANQAILKRLYAAPVIKISDQIDLLKGLPEQQVLYWRVPASPEHILKIAELSVEQLARVIVNIELWKGLNPLQQQAVAAIHLKQSQLMQLSKGELNVGQRYIAACHDRSSAEHAQEIGCDALLLSPVLETLSHPNSETLGWEQLSLIAEEIHIPIFALGGLQLADLAKAQSYGAYGIAGQRSI